MNVVERQYDFTDQDLQAVLAKAEANSLRSFDEFEQQVAERFASPGLKGITLPWSKTHDLVRLAPKTVSIWAGINKHRKSTLLNQVALWATKQTTVGIASLEMPADMLSQMLVTQAAATEKPAPKYAGEVFRAVGRKLWFYDRLGSVPPLEILGACHAMAQKGCGLIVLDSLSLCRVSDDMERERTFMSELTALAKALDVHIALVHHVRKPGQGGDEYVPSRFDVKGSGSIVDLCDQLFLCWANKAKAKAEYKQQLGMALDDKETALLDEADQRLIVAAQRYAPFEGQINLWHHPSRQFTADKRRQAMTYL